MQHCHLLSRSDLLTQLVVMYSRPPRPAVTVMLLPPATLVNQRRCSTLYGSLHHDGLPEMLSLWVPICTPSVPPAVVRVAAMVGGMVTVMGWPAGAHRPVLSHLVPPRGGMGPV